MIRSVSRNLSRNLSLCVLAPLGLGAAAAPLAIVPQASAPAPLPLLTARIVARYPHDPSAFTEGLIWSDGALYESVGRERQSDVRRVRLADGRVTARVTIPPAQFGEGLARWRDQLISLTWHDGVAHRWNARTLKQVGAARYVGEGWGLASDGNTLLLSDGTPTIKRLDAASFRQVGRIDVTVNNRPLDQINELEVVDGAILANVWHQPYLVRIDPATGAVNALVDLRPLVAEVKARDPEAVANGIAWDAAHRRLFVTGKLWPTLFEVALQPAG